MSDFNKVLKYLRYTRRTEEASQKYTRRSAVLIDFDYDESAYVNEEDLVYVEKEKLSDTSFFRALDDFTTNDTSTLYLKDTDNNTIEYYIKYEDISTNEATYRKLPQLSDDEIFQQNELTPVAVPLQTMYDYEENRCLVLLEEEVFLYEDMFIYHPNDIDLKNGSYKYDFEDDKGYLIKTGETIEAITNPAILLKRIFIDTDVEFTKSNIAQTVNIFPRMGWDKDGYFLKYNRYEKALPIYSIMGIPVITLYFKHFGGLLTFLNNTLFYHFKNQEEDGFLDSKITEVKTLQGTASIETRNKKTFLDNYRWFIKDLLNSNIDPLQILYYLPKFYYNNEDKGFLWDTITKALKSNTTNAVYKKEDVVAHLIKVLGILFYKDHPTVFLIELSTRKAGNKTLMERIISNIDGNNFNDLMLFLIKVWSTSDYATTDLKKRKHIKDGDKVLNPPICGYTSGSTWSFFYENTNFNWSSDGHLLLKVKTENGTNHYKYHPLDLIAISNAENEPSAFTAETIGFISFIPAFALYAHSDVTFWKNTALAAEYTGDVLSIATGLGPAWKALRIVSAAAKTTSKAQKVFMITRSAVGVMEVTAGTGKIILNATEYIKTPFGKELAKVFMWMEFASLGSDISIGVAKRLSESSKIALAKADSLLKASKITSDDVKKFTNEILTETKLTLTKFKQMGHLLLGQLEGARYIVGQKFRLLAGAIAKDIKAAGVQVLELADKFFKALDGIGDELLKALGLNRLDYEFALANGRGYLITHNGKSFFTSSLDEVKGFFNAMGDHLKKGGRRSGKNFDKVDEAFETASNGARLEKHLKVLKNNPDFIYEIENITGKLSKWLTKELEATIRYYTTSAYESLNEALRGFGTMTESI